MDSCQALDSGPGFPRELSDAESDFIGRQIYQASERLFCNKIGTRRSSELPPLPCLGGHLT